MSRAVAAVALVVLALVGCASGSGTSRGPTAQPDAERGPIDPRARTRPATSRCDGGAPPVPLIKAERTETRIRIEYEVLARPSGCEPEAIQITANSVDKLDNMAPGKGAGGPIRLDHDQGVVELKLPPLDLPPYEARASTITERGRSSETTTVPVPETGRYCRRTQSAAVCIAKARAKFTRCLRGKAPRAACPDYVWNARPLIPYEPLVGVTREKLEQSFVLVALREGSDPRIDTVSCRTTRWCLATWRGYDSIFRARYMVSGYGSRAGCWMAERRAILEETPPRYEHAAPLRHLISDRKYGCAAWLR